MEDESRVATINLSKYLVSFLNSQLVSFESTSPDQCNQPHILTITANTAPLSPHKQSEEQRISPDQQPRPILPDYNLRIACLWLNLDDNIRINVPSFVQSRFIRAG